MSLVDSTELSKNVSSEPNGAYLIASLIRSSLEVFRALVYTDEGLKFVHFASSDRITKL